MPPPWFSKLKSSFSAVFLNGFWRTYARTYARTYCSLCILNAAETHIQKLQLIQNQALRIISKFPAYVAIEDLHDCSGLPYVKDYLAECAQKKLTVIKKASSLVGDVIAEYNQVKDIRENASILDILGD